MEGALSPRTARGREDVLADAHSSTVPDSPNARVTQMFTLPKGHKRCQDQAVPWMGEPQTPYGKGGRHKRRSLPRAIYTERLGETNVRDEQIGGLRGCGGNGVNHKRA